MLEQLAVVVGHIVKDEVSVVRTGIPAQPGTDRPVLPEIFHFFGVGRIGDADIQHMFGEDGLDDIMQGSWEPAFRPNEAQRIRMAGERPGRLQDDADVWHDIQDTFQVRCC